MNFCWAGVYSAYKIIGQDGLMPGGIVTLRFGLAAVCLLLIWPWLKGPAPRGKDLITTMGIGLILFVVGQRLQVYGNYLGTAGNSSVLMAVEPLLTSVAAALFLGEHIGPRRLAGFGLGLLGVGILNGVWTEHFRWTNLSASLIFVSSFICEAAYSVMGKPVVQRSNIFKVLTISLVVAAIANLLIDGPSTLAAARGLSWNSWGLLVVLAVVCTVLGYSLWFLVIRNSAVNLAALTVFAQAVFGVGIASAWLGEELHWGQILGCATIVAGLVLGFSRQVKKRSPIAETASVS